MLPKFRILNFEYPEKSIFKKNSLEASTVWFRTEAIQCKIKWYHFFPTSVLRKGYSSDNFVTFPSALFSGCMISGMIVQLKR